MKISERKLRRLVKETILESLDPNEPTSIGGRFAPHAKSHLTDYIPGSGYVKGAMDLASTAKGALADRSIADAHQGKEIAGFSRACRQFEQKIRETHKSTGHVDVAHIFNSLLRENGVTRYYVYEDSMDHAGEFEAIDI